MTMDPAFPSASGTGAPAPSGSPVDRRRAVVEALMRLAAIQPWSDIELTDVAREAGITLSDMRDLFPSKGAILDGFTRMIDKEVIGGTADDLVGEPARERVFDVIMRRLDAMAPYKAALRRISWALRSDPFSLAALNRSALNSTRYMLAAAGVPTEGSLGFIKLQGTVIAVANVMETWFEDDDPSGAKTMARLDRELSRGERVLERADDVRRLTAPFRAIGRALLEGRSRGRDRGRRRGALEDPAPGETADPAGAI
jgi:AcrR family transcriptional regulator